MSLLSLDTESLRERPLPAAVGGKEGRGALLVIGGGAGVPGAPILTGLAGLRVGAGKLQLAATPSLAGGLGLAVPEAQIITVEAAEDGEIAESAAASLARAAKKADAVVIGPGMLNEDNAARLGVAVLRAVDCPAVVDAAALVGLKAQGALSGAATRLVLTPHHGEMAALMDADREDVAAAPQRFALEAARRFNAVVALKSADTIIVTPDGEAWRHEGGVHGLGTSGSGDVLAGVIGGLVARGASPIDAALWGVRMHALAGEAASETIAPIGFLARDIVKALPRALAKAQGP